MPGGNVPDLVTIDLRAGSLSICLRSPDPGWCRVQAIATTGIIVLGSDDLTGLATALDALLSDELASQPRIVVDNCGLHQGRVLADTRVLVCAADVAGMRELAFVRHGAVVESVALDARQQTQWRYQLSAARWRRRKLPGTRHAARWPRRRRARTAID